MAITIGDVVALLKIDDKPFDSALNNAEKKAKSWAERTGSTIGKGITVAVVSAAASMAAMVTGAMALAAQAAPLENIQKAFEGIARASGESADTMIRKLQEGSAGMVAQRDLMMSYNSAAQLVSTTFANQLPEAMTYLRKVSAATGEDMGYMIDSLVKGVGRLSPMILDNLGVQVSLTAANEAYAKSIGKNAEELTKAEQQTAVYNAVLQQLKINTAAMPDVLGTNAQRLAALKAAVLDLRDGLGKGLQPVLAATLSIAEGGLPILQRLGQGFVNLLAPVGRVVAAVAPLVMGELQKLIFMVLPQGENIGNSLAQGLANSIPYIVAALRTIRRVIAYWLQPGSPPRLLPELDKWGAGAAQAYMDGWEKIDTSVFDFMADQVHDALYDAVAAGELSPDEFLSRMFGSRTAIAKALDELKKTGEISEETMAEVTEAAGPAGDAIRQLLTDMAKSGGQAEQMASILDQQRELIKLQKEQAKLQASLMPRGGGGFGGRAGDAAAKEAEQAAKRAAEAQWQYEYSLAGTTERLEMMRQKLAETEAESAEYWNTLQQVRQLESQVDAEAQAQQNRLTDAQWNYNYATADTAGKLALMQAALEGTEQNTAEYYDTLLKVQRLQEQLAAEQEAAQKRAQEDAQAAAEAQWQYNYSQADTAGKLEMMRQKLAETTEGTADYWQTLQSVADLEKSKADEEQRAAAERERNQQAAIDAEWQYRFALADTEGQLAMLREKLADTEEGSADYYDVLLKIAQIEKQRNNELERGAGAAGAAIGGLAADLSGMDLALPPLDTEEFTSGLTAALDPEKISAEADKLVDKWWGKLVGDDENGPLAKVKRGIEAISTAIGQLKEGDLSGAIATLLPPDVAALLVGPAEDLETVLSNIKKALQEIKDGDFAGALEALFGPEILTTIQGWGNWFETTGIPILIGLGASLATLATIMFLNAIPGFIAWATTMWTTTIPALIAQAAATWAAIAPLLPIVALIAGIGIAVGLLVAAWQNDWGGIRTTLTEAWENHIKPALEAAWKFLSETLPEAVGKLPAWFKEKWDSIKETISTTWNEIKEKAEAKVEEIKTGIVTKFNEIKNGIKEKIEGARDDLVTTWNTIKGNAEAKVEELKDGIVTRFTNIKDEVKTKIEGVRDDLKEKWDEILNKVKDTWNSIKTAVGDTVGGLWDKYIKTPLDNLRKKWDDFWGGIRDKLTGFLDGIHIKLPHINVHWHELPVLGRIPSGVSIDWYAKGADFIANQAMLIGVGEAGPERVTVEPLTGPNKGKYRGDDDDGASMIVNYNDFRQEPTSNLDRLGDLARGLEWRRRMRGVRV